MNHPSPPSSSGDPDAAPPPAACAVDAAFAVDHIHRIRFTTDVFDPANDVLRRVLEASGDSAGRAIAFVDESVAQAWPDLAGKIKAYAVAHSDVLTLDGDVNIVPGGEQAKNDWSVYQSEAGAINEAGICRHSYVLAVGGGAMLDAVGFAAATAHRGVRLIRFPTTTLSQGDGGIGVKNGINAFGKKNFLGTFDPPWAVINDELFPSTLTNRDWRAGLSEAVKVALLKDAAFFERIETTTDRLAARDETIARPIIRLSAMLHLNHITDGGDPFELLNARPLDFGHWSAHKIEQMSDFRISHGAAVAIGIALDVIYSMASGLLDESDCRRVLACLNGIGLALYDESLADHDALLTGLAEFREHLGGRLTITLLEGVGRPVEVHEIDRARMVESVKQLAECARALTSG